MNEQYGVAKGIQINTEQACSAAPTPPLTSELRRLETLSTGLVSVIDALEAKLGPILPIAVPCAAEKVVVHDTYGIPFPDYASDSNDRIERQIARLESLLRDVAI